MNKTQEPSVALKLEKLNTYFYLMVGLPLLAFTWIYLNLRSISPHEYFVIPASRPYLHGIVLITSLAIAVWAFLQYRQRFTGLEPYTGEQADFRESTNRKVELFKRASLKKYILLTISTVIIIVGFYFSAEENYGAAYSILLIMFSINLPTPQRLFKDMRLKKEERELVFTSIREHREKGSNK